MEAAINGNYDVSSKKKPQAMDSSSLEKIKGRPIVEMKTLKLPPPDPKSFKINGISWGTDQNSNLVAFARQDHLLGVVNAEKNNYVACCKASWTQCMAMHPNKPIVLSGGMDNATTVWGLGEGKMSEKTKIIEHDGYIASLVFTDKGDKYLSAAGDGDIRLVDMEKKTTLTRFCGHIGDAQSLTFASSDKEQKLFATCSSDKTVKLWDVTSGQCTHSFKAPSELNACAMHPMEKSFVACGGEMDKTFLFDIRACKMISTYARNNMKTASLCWSISGRTLFVGHDDGAIVMWDIYSSGENKEYANKVIAHQKPDPKTNELLAATCRVQNLKVGEDGILASGGFDGKIKLWGGPK